MRTLQPAGFALLMMLSACAGGPPNTPTPTPTPTPAGPQTMTFTGSASISSTGGCSGQGHAISTGTGALMVTLVQSSAARVAMQVCHPSAVNHALECTLPPFAVVAVGSEVTATLKGGAAQVITVFPETCGQPGMPTATTITYTIRANYPG
jgi:hypothetical protein